ncbi:MAG TPA: PHP domain-containing protein [Spirochaetales bacterium]|nr:PHP domain-containing protein [Spirochaetales bacterium]
MKADLHFHSRYSDGCLWPSELAERAARAGLEAAALTDHDTFGGWPEFRQAAERRGLATWPAVEIDCVDKDLDYKSELLAYFPSGSYGRTEALLAEVRIRRRAYLMELFSKAAAAFGRAAPSFSSWERERMDGRLSADVDPAQLRFGKPDLFRALVAAGALSQPATYRQFKRAYLDTGIIKAAKPKKPSVRDVCAAVLEDGGMLSIPHIAHEFKDDPARMERQRDRLARLLARFHDYGVASVELYAYGPEQDRLNSLVADVARTYGFQFTYGSDYHDRRSASGDFGSFHGDFAGFPA